MPTIDPITASPARLKARSRLALAAQVAKRQSPGDAAAGAVEEARRDYRAVTLEDHIRKVVDAAPPLTAEQRDRLSLLLTEAGGHHAS